ncbi:MAG: alanine racemase [Deltaproteobacteria bacterium]|nr:alanine racemase [Deltaproteobacteria bacterium]
MRPNPVLRPTAAIIHKDNLIANYCALRKRAAPGAKMLAVVKADAYGHGAIETVRALERQGCEFFAVAILEEGLRLRDAGIKSPVLILCGVYPGQAKALVGFGLTPVVFDLKMARALNAAAKKAGMIKKIHLKLDTGMGRLGILNHEVHPFIRKLKQLEYLELEGVLSHFSDMEKEDKGFSKTQLKTFLKSLELIKEAGYNPPLVHMSNSAVAVDFKDAHFTLVRTGLMLYGSYPSERFKGCIRLEPVMEFKTRILYLKEIPKGFPVGYGRRFAAKRKTLIAVISAGYADGIPRRVTGKGEALVRGKRAPFAGTICMDLAVLDVTDVPEVKTGDEVVVIGAQGPERITVEEVARWAGTIPYEIFTNISSRVPRVYV